MIRPAKYLDLNTSVLNVAGFILNELHQSGALPLSELNEVIRTRLGESTRFSFSSALNFLFLLGKLNYDQETDVIVPSINQTSTA
jgi:hypothetical protein